MLKSICALTFPEHQKFYLITFFVRSCAVLEKSFLYFLFLSVWVAKGKEKLIFSCPDMCADPDWQHSHKRVWEVDISSGKADGPFPALEKFIQLFSAAFKHIKPLFVWSVPLLSLFRPFLRWGEYCERWNKSDHVSCDFWILTWGH